MYLIKLIINDHISEAEHCIIKKQNIHYSVSYEVITVMM